MVRTIKPLKKQSRIVEVEMSDPDFPNYLDTIHEARHLGGRKYQLTAFHGHGSIDEWDAHQVHAPRRAEPNRRWKADDPVHIRISGRKVCGKPVDGGACSVWVKGTVMRRKYRGRYTVMHRDWEGQSNLTTSEVEPERIRSAW